MFENIYKRKFIFLVLLGLLIYSPSVFSQLPEMQAKSLLADRGISEDTLRARLLKKGFNPDNIAPADIGSFQSVIMETVAEIEADQNKNKPGKEVEEKKEPNEDLKLKPFEGQPLKEEKSKSDSVSLGLLPAPIYGQEIFRNNSIAVYQKSEDLEASDAYVLGVGDKLGIIGFGRSQFEQILEISQDGFVKPGNNFPNILLRGVRFGDAKELLYQRYSQYYVITRGEFQVTLNKPRNMTVNVFGEAKTTGSFTLPGINTAFNVISAAGGPTDIGSVRRIKVIRGNVTIPLDVYEFMNDPGVAKNFFLQNNDYIHIPVAQKVIKIEGAVTRPMSYELLDQENLAQLVKYAGGAKANAYLSDVQITRYLNDKKTITNVNFRELIANGGDYVLYNGDNVVVKTIEENTENTVSIAGAVVFPGTFERSEGMTVYDLLSKSVLKPEARLDFAYVLKHQADGTYKYDRINLEHILNNRSSAENILLSNQDMMQVMTLKTYVNPGFFSVVGAVRAPDTFAFNPAGRLKLEDAILLAGGTLIDASDFGYIMRLNPSEPKTIEYVHFNLSEALSNPSSTANIDIQPGDQIRVFDKASRRDDFTVSIFGAVRHPGEYPFGPSMSLSDLISLAGGFTYEADNERIDIARSEFSNGHELKITQYAAKVPKDFEGAAIPNETLTLNPFDHVYVRTIPEYEMQQTVTLNGEVKYPGTYPLLQDKEKIYDLIQRAGGLTGEAFPQGAKLYREGDSTGLVVIDLFDILQNHNVVSNIILRNGDVLNVPKSRDLVTIGGYVNLDDAYSYGFLKGQTSISVAFRGEKSAKYYIDKFAAGISERGAPGEVKVQFADGRVEKTRQFLWINSYPKVKKGATITVGSKPVKTQAGTPEKKVEWGSVLKDTMAQATAVLTLLILVNQLSK